MTGLFLVLGGQPVWASSPELPHTDPFGSLVLYLSIILLAAKAGGYVLSRIGLPEILGELGAGILLGNLTYLHLDFLTPLKTDPTLGMLSHLGIILLLFYVGLETTVGQMVNVGFSALLVGVSGIIAPFLLGWGAGRWLLPGSSGYVHAFLGTTLCATSIGITARVFKDMGRVKSPEGRVILGAAVIDDVLALVMLAIVAGIITQEEGGKAFSYTGAAWILAKACLFLGGSLVLGVYLAPRLFHLASRVRAKGVLLVLGLGSCFFMSYAADAIGLAPIIGAFTAGLILEPSHYKGFVQKGEQDLETLIKPLSDFLVPIFFVMVGVQTDLGSMAKAQSLILAAGLTLAAVVGKQVCGLFVLGRGINRLAVGLGMVPRGEVTLIMANVGMDLNLGGDVIVDPTTYSAIVIMVILTTLMTPPALEWSLRKGRP